MGIARPISKLIYQSKPDNEEHENAKSHQLEKRKFEKEKGSDKKISQ